MTEAEMVGWHHQLDGHEFQQAPGVGNGQGSLVCCKSWGPKESDTTEQLNQTELSPIVFVGNELHLRDTREMDSLKKINGPSS